MKQNSILKHAGLLIVALGLGTAGICPAQTNFTVTAPNYIFDINGVGTGLAAGFEVNNSPALSLHAGATYTFTVSTSILHPMGIVTTAPVSPSPSSSFYSGGVPTSQYNGGTTTLTIPATGYPSKLYYQCNNHGFYGVITVLPPLVTAPPPNTIISLVFSGTNVVVTSSGTNTTYTLVPEFNSNIVSGTWQSVPSFTNSFASGTNTTTFGRLDAICGPNVFLRISQRP